MKKRIYEGSECRHCDGILIRREVKSYNPKAKYHFKELLQCNKCKKTYTLSNTKYGK